MRATAILGLVRRLLTQEAVERQDPAALTEAAEQALDKLRVHLSNRIGQEGFRTLLARALTLTTAQFPYLSAIHVAADGSLVGLRAAVGAGTHTTRDKETLRDVNEGAVALVAHLLALLITFIGENLTRRILSAAWPELALDDLADPENDRP